MGKGHMVIHKKETEISLIKNSCFAPKAASLLNPKGLLQESRPLGNLFTIALPSHAGQGQDLRRREEPAQSCLY